jgi:hypothetical protein
MECLKREGHLLGKNFYALCEVFQIPYHKEISYDKNILPDESLYEKYNDYED